VRNNSNKEGNTAKVKKQTAINQKPQNPPKLILMAWAPPDSP